MTRDAALIDRLSALDSNIVSDVLDKAGLRHQVLSPKLRPVDPGRILAGVALCARGRKFEGGDPPAQTASMFDLDAAVTPGAIIVIEYGPDPVCAMLGGFMARGWQASGSVGLVTDGLIRDTAEIAGIGYPAYATGCCPAASVGRWTLTEVGGTATLPGRGSEPVTVNGGDILIGDADGVAVIPQQFADRIVAAAETLKEIEGRILQAMQSGLSRKDAFDANPRFDHIPKLV